MEHAHLLESDQAAFHHAIEDRKEHVDPLLAVDDLDHQRQVFREAKNLGGVQSARMAIAHRAAEHGCAGKMHLARLEYNRFVERFVVVTIILANEDTKQDRLVRYLHGSRSLQLVETDCRDVAEPHCKHAQNHG